MRYIGALRMYQPSFAVYIALAAMRLSARTILPMLAICLFASSAVAQVGTKLTECNASAKGLAGVERQAFMRSCLSPSPGMSKRQVELNNLRALPWVECERAELPKCVAEKRSRSETLLAKALSLARQQMQALGEPFVAALESSQAAWSAYRESQCTLLAKILVQEFDTTVAVEDDFCRSGMAEERAEVLNGM